MDGIPGGAGDGEVGRLPDRVVVPEGRGGDLPRCGGPGQRAPVGVEAQLGRQRARGQLAGGEEGEAAPPTVSTRDTVATDGSDRRNAALVTKVVVGSAAEKAGVTSGDAVIAVDGTRVDSSLSLVASIRAMQSGSSTTLTVLRDGQRLDLRVTLGTRG